MAELKGKKRKQPSSRPEGWLAAGIVVQLELTCRQDRYARRSVGIARFVYNRMVANDQAGRDAGLWLSPNPPMGGVKAGQIGMREPTREKAWAPLGPM